MFTCPPVYSLFDLVAYHIQSSTIGAAVFLRVLHEDQISRRTGPYFFCQADASSTTSPRHVPNAPHKFTMQEVVQGKLNAAQLGGRPPDERQGLA